MVTSRRRREGEVVVCSGGGSAGAAQAGMLAGLLEAGVRPDRFVAVSVGAINATFVAVDPTVRRAELMVDRWEALRTKDLFAGSWPRRLWQAARTGYLHQDLQLRHLVESIGCDRLEDLKVPTEVGTVDVDACEMRWWSSGPLVDCVTASAALPGVFPAQVIGGRAHIDGGVFAPVPIRRGVDHRPLRLWVLDVSDPAGGESRHPVGAMLRAFASLRRHIVESELAEVPEKVRVVHVRFEDLGIQRPAVTDLSRSGELAEAGRQHMVNVVNDTLFAPTSGRWRIRRRRTPTHA